MWLPKLSDALVKKLIDYNDELPYSNIATRQILKHKGPPTTIMKGRIVGKTQDPIQRTTNCSYECAYDCAQVQYTILGDRVWVQFPVPDIYFGM